MNQREYVTLLEDRVKEARKNRDYYASCTWSEIARGRYLTSEEVCAVLENLLCDERGKLIRELAA